MKNRIYLSAGIIILLLSGMLSVPSFAQDEVNITVATASGLVPGNTIYLPVDMFTDPANNIFTGPGYINVYFDPDILTPIEPFAANNPPKEVLVFSMIGKQILHQSFNQQGLISIPTTNRAGYYIVKVVSEGGCSTGKVFLK
ncbi:MAG: T9SS type A sorting domain-containing protein [Bacteroidetes bacterium]|nr:T9SS type A sorting domain-containing protein [Bacteroidota bacterium]